ncbi:hypothetical protein PVIIG_05319 [Plasmodium vivax India VII]|uniref:VIR protein n=1 Tax=Plasmodium vivax India VII TaxID=1077284 RepID=A0A0J9UTF9_PLAVI|nr:hypothetical protein PVIIG_05319 [Plasmodium vivax India VII]
MLTIDPEELKNMNTLYDLYNIYNTLISLHVDDNKICRDYSEQCARLYTNSMKKCSDNKFTKFCNALNSFKEKYDQIYSLNTGVCNSSNILPLSQDKILLEVKDLDTEQLGGVKVESLKGFPPQSLGTKSQEASLDPVKEVRGDSGQEVRGDSVQQGIGGLVQQDIGDIQQSDTPVVEGKQSDNYNRVVSGAGTMLGAFSICMIMYKVKYIPYKNVNIAKK